MSSTAAITIRRTEQELAAQLATADPPLFGEGATVTFAPAPGDRGTEVRVVVDREAPGGTLGQKVAAVVGTDPQSRLTDVLRRFKQVMETGEVVRSEGSPEGHSVRQHLDQQPAQPAKN